MPRRPTGWAALFSRSPAKATTYKELDARNAQPPKRWQVTEPEGAPNLVVVLIDDIGFGASSALGRPINMPNLEKIAADEHFKIARNLVYRAHVKNNTANVLRELGHSAKRMIT